MVEQLLRVVDLSANSSYPIRICAWPRIFAAQQGHGSKNWHSRICGSEGGEGFALAGAQSVMILYLSFTEA